MKKMVIIVSLLWLIGGCASVDSKMSVIRIGQKFRDAKAILQNHGAIEIVLQQVTETDTWKSYNYELSNKAWLTVYVDKKTSAINKLRLCKEPRPSKAVPPPQRISVTEIQL